MKIFVVTTFAFFIFFTQPVNAKPEKLALSINAEAGILMNADTGVILFEKNIHDLHYPASTLKIATALYALQNASDQLDDMVTADQDCIGTVKEEAIRKSNYTLAPHLLIPDGSHIGIKRGETLSLRDLFYGMLVASGDDAANVIAKHVGGTIPDFMKGMNTYVKQLGCQSTIFYNPHGLHHPKQQTTAYDLANLTREALKNPIFREMVATVRYTRPKTNKQESSILVQTNRLLRNGPYFYSKAIGVKTGYYSLAGHNLVAAATDGDRTLIAVLLKENERKDIFIDAKKMFEAAFSQPKVQRTLLHKGKQKFEYDLPGAETPLSCYIKENFVLEYYPAEEPAIQCLLIWDKNLRLPIKKNQRLGEILVKKELVLLQKIPIYSMENANFTWGYRVKNFFTLEGGFGNLTRSVCILLSIFLILFLILKNKKNKLL